MVRAVIRATDFTLLVTLDLIIGLGWLLLDPSRSSNVFYDPAKIVLGFTGAPIRWWGVVLIVLAVLKYIGLRFYGSWLPAVAFALGLFWTWWLTVTVIYFHHGNGNFYGMAGPILLMARHFALFFKTWSHRLNLRLAQQGR